MTSYGKRLRLVYIGALACIAALSVASQGYLGSLEGTLSNDAPVLNVAGKQLTLSQRIARLSQRIYYELVPGELEEASTHASELRESLGEWQRAHRALVSRRGALGLEGSNSFEIAKDLPLLDTHIESASEASEQLIAASNDPSTIEGQTTH